MSDPHDIAGPVLAHLRKQDWGDGTVGWPGDLTEDEQVAYMMMLQEAGYGGMGIVSFSPAHARASIEAGRLVE